LTAYSACRGGFAEFEINLCKGRQTEGIAGAKANRVHAGKGSPALIEAVTMPEMNALAAASHAQAAQQYARQEAKKPRQADDPESGWRLAAAPDEALSFLLSYPASLL
jgi:hypothetical protein